MDTLKLTQIGNSVGAIFQKDMLLHLNVGKGDTLYVTRTPEGLLLSPYNPEVAAQVDQGREFMKQYRDTLRELAK
jgi:putative addiction module antidote